MARKKKPEPPKKKFTKPPAPPVALVTTFVPPWESGIPGPKAETHEPDPDKFFNWDHLHERTKVVRRVFVSEFLKDFHPAKAVLRMGLQYEHPDIQGNNWLKEPYTQFLIDKLLNEMDEKTYVTRARIIGGLLKEASTGIEAAARVSAWGKIAKIMGMEITKVEGNIAVNGGVMLVPLGGTPEQWEANAANAQAALKVHAVA